MDLKNHPCGRSKFDCDHVTVGHLFTDTLGDAELLAFDDEIASTDRIDAGAQAGGDAPFKIGAPILKGASPPA